MMHHTSSPKNRNSILKHGLIPNTGVRRCLGNENLPPAVFLSNKEFYFDTTFDDDIYEVNWDKSKMIRDNAMENSYYQFEPIPIKYLKLIYKGTGIDKLKQNNGKTT